MINKAKEVRTICWVNVMNKYIENIIVNLALVYLFVPTWKLWKFFGNYYFYFRFSFVNDIYSLLKFQDYRKRTKN